MESPPGGSLRRWWSQERRLPLPRVSAQRSPDSPPELLPPPPPRCIQPPSIPDSGWARLRSLFDRDDTEPVAEEVENVLKAAVSGAIIGWAYGGLPAFYQAKQRYIERSHAEMYHSRLDAVQSAHRVALRGFLRYGWRWSWRTAAFVTIFNSVSTALTVYRDKDALSHFVVAGGVTGGLFRMQLGLAGLVGGSVFGALLGALAGSGLTAVQKLYGETAWERRRRERRELYQLKLEEWRSRLQATHTLAEEMETALREKQTEEDIRKIEALLSLPRNPPSAGAAEKS
ncbi:complex I assembly factor TIMMDC1, mitochondrial [Tachyglossus aculeatus]|uniref:complex I assembly factor TIMMDC1, mitochondrial n=1 Tax=Tachyglossus aculeatus TaxID=9261 RepID=UPI0018F416DD|nr:complex I assembly factor TIMMDC1, mitochondrial [Tachyglossus aculeatus]